MQSVIGQSVVREIYFKELAQAIVGAGQPNVHSQQAATHGGDAAATVQRWR